MEIKGEDFIKNVQMKQEKNDLRLRLEEIEATEEPQNASYSYEDEIDQTESELDDIMLGANEPQNNDDNKKKYVVLGLVLAVLFLITIIIFRLLNNQTSTDDSFVQNTEEIPKEKVLNNEDNIEQEYQKIINEKLKSIEQTNQKTEVEKKSINDSLNLERIQREERKMAIKEKAQQERIKQSLKKDVFDIQKKEAVKPKVVKKVVAQPRPVVKKEVKKVITQPKVTTKASGNYIQVGAFTKVIDQKYLAKIKANGYNYRLYKVNVKGTDYTKVLVGPYNSRQAAQNDMTSIKKKLSITSAFILKL